VAFLECLTGDLASNCGTVLSLPPDAVVPAKERAPESWLAESDTCQIIL
jgi:hypothetical protein